MSTGFVGLDDIAGEEAVGEGHRDGYRQTVQWENRRERNRCPWSTRSRAVTRSISTAVTMDDAFLLGSGSNNHRAKSSSAPPTGCEAAGQSSQTVRPKHRHRYRPKPESQRKWLWKEQDDPGNTRSHHPAGGMSSPYGCWRPQPTARRYTDWVRQLLGTRFVSEIGAAIAICLSADSSPEHHTESGEPK